MGVNIIISETRQKSGKGEEEEIGNHIEDHINKEMVDWAGAKETDGWNVIACESGESI